jgi:hypothetical protein
MYQLAETYGMTESAVQYIDAAPEYQAVYTGSTYDGNKIDLQIIQKNPENAPVLPPDPSFVPPDPGPIKPKDKDKILEVTDQVDVAKECTASQSTNGARMSADMAEIDKIWATMGKQPNCDEDEAVSAWNSKTQTMGARCDDFNTNGGILANKCQVTQTPMECSSYKTVADKGNIGMLIKPCPKPKCTCGPKNLGCCDAWIAYNALLAAFAIIVALFLGPLAAIMLALVVVTVVVVYELTIDMGNKGFVKK